MGFLSDLFGSKPKSEERNTQQNKSSLNLSLTQKYTTDKPNNPWQAYESRDGLKDLQIKDHKTEGNGKFAREIADELGIQCKGTDSPNVKVVNSAARELNLAQTGRKLSSTFTKNNGGSGYRGFETPLYSNEQELKIKAEIEKKSVLVDPDKGVYKYNEIPFRVDKKK
jgi:hypothetical protein